LVSVRPARVHAGARTFECVARGQTSRAARVVIVAVVHAERTVELETADPIASFGVERAHDAIEIEFARQHRKAEIQLAVAFAFFELHVHAAADLEALARAVSLTDRDLSACEAAVARRSRHAVEDTRRDRRRDRIFAAREERYIGR